MRVFFEHVVAFFGAIFLGLYFVPVMIRASKKLRLLDVPDGKIKNHKKPIPYLGGVAVYMSFITVLALIYPFGNRLVWFLIGTTLLLFVGLIDDFNVLTPLQKLLGQIFAVTCFLKGGFALKSCFFDGYINIFASGFWLLSVINAFNLVDVMDGLATVLGIVSAASFLVVAVILGHYQLSLLLVIFIGSLFAFLWYNKPSAKIYLGDAGSLFIGGFIAALPLLFRWTKILNDHSALPSFAKKHLFFETAVSAMVPILLVGVPLLEVFSLVVIRKYKKIPFYNGSPHHFALFLKRKGYKVTKILLFSVFSASFLSILGLFFLFGKISFPVVCAGIFSFLVFWLFCIYR